MSLSKRLFDLPIALVGLCVALPILLLVAVLIKLDDGGPVFFRQNRVGHKGKLFRIWKFRTMIIDAERRGITLTVGQDPRITRVGLWLRRFKIDEFPQLINVIVGEMSLVGPRPEVPRLVNRYTPEQRQILEAVPGITDPASIAFRSESEILAGSLEPEELYVREIMPKKLQMNMAYLERANRITDLVILFKTALVLFQPKGH